MQYVNRDPRILQRQRWQKIWPTPLLAVIAFSQMLLTFMIIGFETWSMIINLKYSFIFIGYATSFFFTITWISTFTVVCCNRGSQGCATHALVENILSTIASIVLLYFDAQFLRNPFTCHWPGDICYTINWDIGWSSLWDDFYGDGYTRKLITIKIQLACAAVMLFVSVAYILIYIYTSLKVRAKSTTVDLEPAIELRPRQMPPPPPIPVWSAQPPVWPPPSNF